MDESNEAAIMTGSTLIPSFGPLYGLPIPPFFPPDQLLPTKTTQDNIDTRLAALRLEILALNALRNATLPIHRLPNEILIEVFLMVRHDCAAGVATHECYPRRIGASHWVSITRVCRHWWAVACSTPQLWRTIDVYRNLKWLSLCIERTADATIQISLHYDHTALAAIPTLLTVANRLSTVLLPEIDEDEFQPVHRFLEHKMPQLEELGILHLDGIAMPWSSEVVSRLTSLVLDECLRDANAPRIPLAIFLDVLESCSQLVLLTLREYLSQILQQDTPAKTSDRVISLPKLRSLTLVDHPRRDLAPFLSCINLPLDVDITIHPTLNNRGEETLVAFRSPFPEDRHNIPILASAERVRVTSLMETEITIHAWPPARSGSGGITVDLVRTMYDIPSFTTWISFSGEALTDIVYLFSSSPLTSLDLTGGNLYTSKHQWDLLFTQFPTLETLNVALVVYLDNQADTVPTIFSALVFVPDTDSSANSAVVCPRLQELSISHGRCTDETMLEVEAALRLRATRGVPALKKLRLQLVHASQRGFEARKAVAEALFAEVMPVGEACFVRDDCDVDIPLFHEP
ncbi:hypothetical protein C8Q80DRAFT_1207398 [Daedaleopsis nitida]|nr:hypothetical protein C8Q80DRAFT_1207398 [Daedaleopsis nitida]